MEPPDDDMFTKELCVELPSPDFSAAMNTDSNDPDDIMSTISNPLIGGSGILPSPGGQTLGIEDSRMNRMTKQIIPGDIEMYSPRYSKGDGNIKDSALMEPLLYELEIMMQENDLMCSFDAPSPNLVS